MVNDERIVSLLSIVGRGKGAQYIRTVKDKGLYLNYQFVGAGTASSEMMDILGLGSNDKDIMLSFGTYNAIDSLSGELGKLVGATMGYGGIAMVISPSAFSRITAEIIKRNSKDIVKGDGSNMHSEFEYSLILISVNRGFSDGVMQAAKKAGATGGTVIKARLAEAQEIEAYANTKLDDEKEIVTILAPKSVRNQILEDVNNEFGLKSEAQGTVLSVPVEKVFKI
jgi:hypothetical protein